MTEALPVNVPRRVKLGTWDWCLHFQGPLAFIALPVVSLILVLIGPHRPSVEDYGFLALAAVMFVMFVAGLAWARHQWQALNYSCYKTLRDAPDNVEAVLRLVDEEGWNLVVSTNRNVRAEVPGNLTSWGELITVEFVDRFVSINSIGALTGFGTFTFTGRAKRNVDKVANALSVI
jgi:hypothetical protein